MNKDSEREQRLAEALRANLKRRKAQGRAVAGQASERGLVSDPDEAASEKPQGGFAIKQDGLG